MKIPKTFAPIGPEMAFKMPEGEFLPMWVCDDGYTWGIAEAVTMFDGDYVCGLHNPWRHCMPMEDRPIPESALLRKKPRLMTWHEVAELLGRYRWGQWVRDEYGAYKSTIEVYQENEGSIATGKLRKWGTDELVEPTIDLLETARREAGDAV